MPYYLFTFRPQITEQQLFEDFFTILQPELENLSKYSYTIEEDDTLQKHIHLIAESKAKDNSAFKQLFQKKIFQEFKSALKHKLTNEKGFDDRKVKDTKEDFLHTLGYVNKEATALRRQYKGFTNDEITTAVEYYHTAKRIKSSVKKSDLIIVTARNCHVLIKDYCVRNECEPCDPFTILNMKKENYMFSQCPHLQDTLEELEINMFPDRYTKPEEDEEDSFSYMSLVNRVAKLEELKIQMAQLKKHYSLHDVRTRNGAVEIRGKGSDEDYIRI